MMNTNGSDEIQWACPSADKHDLTGMLAHSFGHELEPRELSETLDWLAHAS